MMLELNRIYNEDCLEGMKRIPDKSVDLIVTDPPYPTTSRGCAGNSGRMKHLSNICNIQMWYLDDFGKTVFLTREEAEKALLELEGN